MYRCDYTQSYTVGMNDCDAYYYGCGVECLDNSDEDEELCKKFICPDGHWKCEDGKCILGKFQCDGHYHCVDNSDEDPEMCKTFQCMPGYWKCSNGMCIDENYVCDGIPDCTDKADEYNCESHSCLEGRIKCADLKACVEVNIDVITKDHFLRCE